MKLKDPIKVNPEVLWKLQANDPHVDFYQQGEVYALENPQQTGIKFIQAKFGEHILPFMPIGNFLPD